jgi:flagellar basal-body rod modification protein FlgD
MASIGNNFLSSSASDPTASASSSATSSSASASDPTSALGNENTFLQLLVAQLKNQDPSQPQDGTQFVTQLAQFSDLEQNIGTKTDLDSIAMKYTGANSTSTSGTTGSSDTTDAQNTQSGTTGTQQVQ